MLKKWEGPKCASEVFDHFSQAALFWRSQSEPEQTHIVKAFRFELGKLEVPAIRERMIGMLTRVDLTLAKRVAQGLGLSVPAKPPALLNESVPADGNAAQYQPEPNKRTGPFSGIDYGQYREERN